MGRLWLRTWGNIPNSDSTDRERKFAGEAVSFMSYAKGEKL